VLFALNELVPTLDTVLAETFEPTAFKSADAVCVNADNAEIDELALRAEVAG
tara:strand:- start:1089 stop:1244 length:156 start_codon:yes stop_codon:yes gene_type:complete